MAAAGAKTEFARWREEEEAEVRKGQVTLALQGGLWSLREVLEPPVGVNKGQWWKELVRAAVTLAQSVFGALHRQEDYWSKVTRSRVMGVAEQKMAWARRSEVLLLSCLPFF